MLKCSLCLLSIVMIGGCAVGKHKPAESLQESNSVPSPKLPGKSLRTQADSYLIPLTCSGQESARLSVGESYSNWDGITRTGSETSAMPLTMKGEQPSNKWLVVSGFAIVMAGLAISVACYRKQRK